MFESCKRTPSAMQGSTCSDQFMNVKNMVDQLEYGKNDSPLITRAIDDVKFYMKTLTGMKKRRPKDNYPIQIKILRERLTSVVSLVHAIWEAKKDSDEQLNMVENYETVRNGIHSGFFRRSNLRDILDITRKKFGTEFPIPVPERFLCLMSQEIMHDPVVASDGFTYERAVINTWIKTSKEKYGHAVSHTGAELEDDVIENKQIKLEITKFLEKYPSLKNEVFVNLEESSSDDELIIKPVNSNVGGASSRGSFK